MVNAPNCEFGFIRIRIPPVAPIYSTVAQLVGGVSFKMKTVSVRIRPVLPNLIAKWIREAGTTAILKILYPPSVRIRSWLPFMKITKEKRLKQEEDYIAFLEKRLNSENYKKNVSSEEYSKTQEKLKKARLVLRMLK